MTNMKRENTADSYSFRGQNRHSPTTDEWLFINKTGKIKMQGFNEFEHGKVSAVIDSGFIVRGSLHIIDMAEQALADVEGCNDIRGSLRYCRTMLQLLLPDEALADE